MELTKHNSFKLFFYVFFVFFIFSCTLDNENTQDYERWTSTDPLAMHFRVREQKYLQGNLLINSSFETGKLLEFDSITHTTKMDGWDLIGKDVVWIHPESDSSVADSSVIHDGLCSIRISRDHAGETEEYGEGVWSNYIKVIPGNYQLSLFLKLENIKNLKSRLGTRLYDAIDIRVICYDRNKIQLDGDFPAPYYNTTIDNSFKGLSFANFDKIDSTGWVHIIGRSHLFPFPDGDLQDETKFVRIFIGLKGTGSMWIDDVQFTYTRWNFTQLERLMPYMDTTLEKSKFITPQPRSMEIRESIIYYRPYYKDLFPVILVPVSADGLTLKAAKLLESKIRALLVNLTGYQIEDIPGLIKTPDTFRQNEASVIFSLGSTDEMKKNAEKISLESIQGKKKGFLIQTLDNIGHIIFLYGNSPEANYYAVQTAIQLFDNKRLLFHNADIIDYPADGDFGLLLSCSSEEAAAFIKENNRTRFGFLYLSDENAGLYSGVRYTTFDKWLYTSKSSEPFLKSDTRKILEKIDGVALLYDDIPADISTETIVNNFYKEIPEINENYTKAIPEFIRKAKTYNFELELMPVYSSNLALNKISVNPRNIFDNDLWVNYNLPFIWSGYQFQTWQIDEADFMYMKQFTRNPLVFFDYSLFLQSDALDYFANNPAYPCKLLASSLFEPFSNEVLPEIYMEVSKTVVVYNYSSIFDKIRLQTASDFFWNPENYDPDLSLFRALVSEFGDINARSLIYFNEYYFKIISDIVLSGIQNNPHKYQRRISANLKQIYILQKELEQNSSGELYHELLQVINDTIWHLEQELDKSGILISVN